MSGFTVTTRLFPDGTVLGAYDAEGFSAFPVSGPPGTPVNTATVEGQEASFTGLEDNHPYFAAGKVEGSWQNIRFVVNAEDPASWHTVGPPGADGATWYSGAGKPSNGLGQNGDWYVDTANGRIYGPKEGAAWLSGYIEIGGGGGEGEGDIVLNKVGENLTAPRIEAPHNLWVAKGTPTHATAEDVVIDETGLTIAAIEGLTAALAGKQPLDSDLTALAALSTTTFGRELLELANAAGGRTKLGLGTAAVEAATAFQTADSDLTAIAALATSEFGRGFLTLANEAAGRTKLGLGTAATQASTAFDAAGAATTAETNAKAASQPLDSDLTAIAALTTDSFGRALLTKTTAAAVRTYIEAGTGGSGITEAEAKTLIESLAQPLDSDLTSIAALTTTSSGRSLLAKTISALAIELLEQTTAANMRTKLGLGTAATEAATAFQPLDSDLTSIAALTTTSSGRELLSLTISAITKELLEQTTAALWRTKLGLGTAAVEAATAFQPLDSDLTSIAALTTTSNGRALLALTTPNVKYDTYTCNFKPGAAELMGMFPIRIPSNETAKFISATVKTSAGTCKVKVKRTTNGGTESEPLKEKEGKTEKQEFTPSAETLADKDLIEVLSEGAATGVVMVAVVVERVKT